MSRLSSVGRARNESRYRGRGRSWETPADLFRRLDREFAFTLDAAASATNAKCASYFTERDDGLAQPWAPHRVWVNPPYGKEIGPWVAKAYAESRHGAIVVMLLPASTDLPWWHEYAMRADELRFLRGRVHFVAPDGARARNAFFSSVVVIFAGGGLRFRG